MLLALGLLTLALPAGALAGSALAASPPAVATGVAHSVSYSTATLTGRIDPRAGNTSYYFQYGPTKAFGEQTALADAGAGTTSMTVSVAIGGLQPLTVYYYRLVAVNSAGAVAGADRALKTTAVPLSLAILVSPNPALYGSTATIQGTLSGTHNTGRTVVLQQKSFPYTAEFADVDNPELTTSTGSFSFPLVDLTQAAQYRVVTTTNPPVIATTEEKVAVRVSAHVGRTGRRHRARIYGTVTPAIDGMEVGIMRADGGRNVLVGGTALRHLNATSSSFSTRIRVKRHALYRVFVKVTNGAQSSNYSSPLFIR
jgi:hypothetical protein